MRVLLELIHGHGAHVDATACVTVPFDLAGQTPAGLPHSIAQLVGHMTYWMEYELARIGGKAPSYPEHAALSWPTESHPESEDHWLEAIRRFEACLRGMEELVRAGPDTLSRPVPLTDPVHSKQAESVEALLWQTVVHNSYHLGQAAQVRRALGAWPPEGGGDTW